MKKTLLAMLFVPALSHASITEQDLACQVIVDAAEAQATILDAPSIIGSIGDTSTDSYNAVIGVNKSFSGASKASNIRAAADAKCESLRAGDRLTTVIADSIKHITVISAEKEIHYLDQALLKATENQNLIADRVEAGTATVTQHAEAIKQTIEIKAHRSALYKSLELLHKSSAQELSGLDVEAEIKRYQEAESKVAFHTARLSADSGWDITVGAGVRQSLERSETTPFAMLGFSWSFGRNDSLDAAERARQNSLRLQDEKSDGPKNSLIDTRNNLVIRSDAEYSLYESLVYEQTELTRMKERLSNVKSDLAQSSVRTLEIRLLVLDGALAGLSHRLYGFELILNQLEKNR